MSEQVIEVNKEKLLNKLIENKENHIKEYEQAVEDYKDVAIKNLEKDIDQLRIKIKENSEKALENINNFDPEKAKDTAGQHIIADYTYSYTEIPIDYSEDYNSAIDRVRWDEREQIPLSFENFERYVRDKWNWKASFTTMVSGLSITKAQYEGR